jgi:hypothetical protein
MNTIGKLLGETTHKHSTGNHTLTIAEIPAHKHNFQSIAGSNGGDLGDYTMEYLLEEGDAYPGRAGIPTGGDWGSYGTLWITETGGSQAHNHGDTGEASNYQPTIVMNWIVKAVMTVPIQSSLVTAYTDSATDVYSCDYINEVIRTGIGDNVPAGTIVDYDGETIPEGWEAAFDDAAVYVGPTQPTDGQEAWIQHSKNLFDINGNVNISGAGGGQTSLNSVSGNVLTSNVNTYSTHNVGQKFTNLNGKTFTVSAKVLSVGTGTDGYTAIYDNNVLKKGLSVQAGQTVTLTYTGTTDNIVVGFATASGTGAQFTDIQVELGDKRTEYEPYATSKILVKTDNNSYDKILDHGDMGHIGVSSIHSKNMFNKNGPLIAYNGVWGLSLCNFINREVLGKTVTISLNKPVELIVFGSNETNNRILTASWTNKVTFVVTEELLSLSRSRHLFFVDNGTWINTKGAQVEYDLQSEIGTERTEYTDFCVIGSDVYMPDEHVVGTWIDGKPIYRRVLKVSTSTLPLSINTGATNIDDLVTGKLQVKQSTSQDSSWRTVPWLYNAGGYGTEAWCGGWYLAESGIIYVQAGTNLSSIQKYIVILEYTKTTD